MIHHKPLIVQVMDVLIVSVIAIGALIAYASCIAVTPQQLRDCAEACGPHRVHSCHPDRATCYPNGAVVRIGHTDVK